MTETISIHRRITGSPAELLVMKAMAETVTAGYLLGFHVTPDDEIIVASEDGSAVSFIVFQEYEDTGELWIIFGYCLPEYRRKGHYRACIESMRQIARDRGYARINTAVHPDNISARSSIEARGGKLQYLGYVFPVDRLME